LVKGLENKSYEERLREALEQATQGSG